MQCQQHKWVFLLLRSYHGILRDLIHQQRIPKDCKLYKKIIFLQYQMTCVSDMFFNIEALVLYILLYNFNQDHFVDIHLKYIWINIAQLVCSVTAFIMSCFIKGRIRHEMDKQVSESAEICEDKRANKKKPLALQSEKHLPSIDRPVNPLKEMT